VGKRANYKVRQDLWRGEEGNSVVTPYGYTPACGSKEARWARGFYGRAEAVPLPIRGSRRGLGWEAFCEYPAHRDRAAMNGAPMMSLVRWGGDWATRRFRSGFGWGRSVAKNMKHNVHRRVRYYAPRNVLGTSSRVENSVRVRNCVSHNLICLRLTVPEDPRFIRLRGFYNIALRELSDDDGLELASYRHA
jgi:hypothetical protein